jgi:hypothetical protein
MSEQFGVKLIKIPDGSGIAAGPVVPFPSTEAERTHVAAEAGKVAKLLAKPSPGQLALFGHLAGSLPEGGYVVREARWIETIMKATKGLSEADVSRLLTFEWTERAISPDELRRDLLAVLKPTSPDRQ